MLQYSNFVTSMRHIIIIIVLLFQASRIELELELKLRLEVELKLEWGTGTGTVSLLWQPVGNVAPTCPAGKRCGEWLIKS